MKNCSHCHESKPFAEFYIDGRRNGHYKYSAWCKACVRHLSAAQVRAGASKARHRKMRLAQGKQPQPPSIKLSPIERLACELWRRARKLALHNGKPFDLTREWVYKKLVCFCNSHYHALGPKHPFKPSLDRVDNAKFYTQDNVRIVWLIENYARNSFTEEDVIEFCKRKLGLL